MVINKVLLFALAGLFVINFSSAQNNSSQTKNYAEYPYWIEMMQDKSVNFYETQMAFNKYWENREVTKGSGWKPFKRWEWWAERHINPDGTYQPADKIYSEYKKYMAKFPNAKDLNGDWENLGPINVPSKGYEGLGRVNAVAFHPTDPDIIYIGAPAGGCWRYDAGTQEWVSTTDELPTLGVSSIVVDWNNPDNVYIGTGDRDAGDAAGMGVFKSSDGGVTWEQWNNGMGNTTVGRMIQHPDDYNTMYAASSAGIFKTEDAGANWSSIQYGGYKDILFKPGNTDVLYSAGGGKFYKSTDAGANWQQITNGLPTGSRSVIAVTPDDPEYVYCLLSNGDSYKGIYQSTNGGASFTEMSTTPNIMSWGCYGGSGGQAWYDLDVAVDPNNKDIIYAGGVNCFKSVDGGVTWDITSHWWGDCGVASVHADLHVLEYNPVNDRLYAGNDGGIYYTENDGVTWPEITSGLPISQVYRIGQCKLNKDKVINGYQDNGTSTYYGNINWQTTNGGDGMECAFDHTDEYYSYSTIYYGDIFRHYNNGNGYKVGGNGSHGMDESGGWITPFCLHEGNSDIMFAGMKNLWVADGVKSNNFIWKKITTESGGDIDVVEHSPANFDLLFYARNGQLYRSDNVMDDDPEWITLNTYLPGSGNVYDVEAHPFNEEIVYITRSTKVYVSENKGFSWTDITGSLPNINMNSLAAYENSIDGIYVGSNAGVYYREAGMDDWIMFSNGLPVDASINEIEIYHNPDNPEEDAIRAGTYGRGLWSSTVWCGIPVADFEANETNVPVGCEINFTDLTLCVPTSWEWFFQGGTPANSFEKNPEGIVYMTEGTFDVTLTVSNSQGTDTKTITDYITVSATAVPEVYFVASDSITCSGMEIQFFDMSTNCPTGWQWEFDPSTVSYLNGTNQNSQNPEVVFEESGSYSVTLTVTNNAGSNNFTKADYMQIGGIEIPFYDDFESGSFGSKSWTIENPDYNITWDVATIGGTYPGDKAAFMNFFDYMVPPGPRDRLITPVMAFPPLDDIYLYFEYAYAKRHTSVTDSLIVKISDDCGDSWNRIFEGGDDNSGSFATHELMTDPFTPAIAE
ncbi:MAG: PKD domain-containing protein, partial [Bacteroidales bacterium]|nr:PKD domain-containing protein [Bacteroidales bacterium]